MLQPLLALLRQIPCGFCDSLLQQSDFPVFKGKLVTSLLGTPLLSLSQGIDVGFELVHFIFQNSTRFFGCMQRLPKLQNLGVLLLYLQHDNLHAHTLSFRALTLLPELNGCSVCLIRFCVMFVDRFCHGLLSCRLDTEGLTVILVCFLALWHVGVTAPLAPPCWLRGTPACVAHVFIMQSKYVCPHVRAVHSLPSLASEKLEKKPVPPTINMWFKDARTMHFVQRRWMP